VEIVFKTAKQFAYPDDETMKFVKSRWKEYGIK